MRFIVLFFLPFFTLWICVFPAVSYAATIQTYKAGGVFMPVTGAAAVALDIGLLAARASPWVGVAVTGYQVGRLVLDALTSEGATVPVNIIPSALPQSTSGGVSWPNLGWVKNAQGVWQPPVTLVPSLKWMGAIDFVHPSAVVACADPVRIALNTSEIIVTQMAPVMTTATNAVCYGLNAFGAVVNTGSILAQSVCSAGYTLVGSVCNLSAQDSVMYPSDNRPTMVVKSDGTGFQLDARDPDNASMSTVPTQIISTGTSGGLPLRTTISPQTGGGMKVGTELQIIGSDGLTTVYRQTATISNLGKVIDSVAANYPGSLAQQSDTALSLPPSSLKLDFPTDYNREATQLQIKSNLDLIKADLDSALVPVDVAAADLALLDAAKVARDAFKADIDVLPVAASPVPVASLFQPFTPSVCQPLSWTFNSVTGGGSHTAIFDLCPWVPMIQRVGSWAMYLLTSAMLFQMFTRRPEGGN